MAWQNAPMSQPITFGTDGWRAVIADGFTFDNVRRVSEAIAVAARTLEPPDDVDRNTLVVGFDRRFLSREFASLVAETLKTAGFRVVLSNAPTPRRRSPSPHGVASSSAGSWSPPATIREVHGLKFKAWYGGSGCRRCTPQVALHAAISRRAARLSIESPALLDDDVAAAIARVHLRQPRAAVHALNFSPLYFAGLWLAVTTTPPRSLRRHAVKEIVCEGVGAFDSTNAESGCLEGLRDKRSNSRERKRRSTDHERVSIDIVRRFERRAATAIASLTRRTLSNVNPSAMTARHPSVPKVIGCDMGAFCHAI